MKLGENNLLEIREGYLISKYKGHEAIKISNINSFRVSKPNVEYLFFSYTLTIIISGLWCLNSGLKAEHWLVNLILVQVASTLFHFIWYAAKNKWQVIFSTESQKIEIPIKYFEDHDEYLIIFEQIRSIQKNSSL
ncbi:MAG: hypothetical protein JXQ87_05465 [Bacteroidia bacterium]